MATKKQAKQEKTTTEVTPVEQSNVPMQRAPAGAIATQSHNADEILRQDILVPYIVLAQGQSDSVMEKKAQMGDIVRSTNAEKLGDPEHPMEAILLHCPKSDWVIEEKPPRAQRFEFRRTEPRTVQNETLPWSWWQNADGTPAEESAKGATEWRRVKRLSVFAVLPHDIAAANAEKAKMERGELPDVSKALTPVMLTFRSSSFKAGKEIVTFFTKARSLGVDIWRYKLSFTDFLDQNDQGSYYVWSVDQNGAKPVPKEDIALVQSWAAIVNQGGLKTDDAAESANYGASPTVDVTAGTGVV